MAQAREWYLKAGLAHDKGLAASAHFNLGTLAAEEARRLAGEHPENVAPDKRQEILDQLKAAVASFRHCLELQPDNARARRDIELVRQWIKYYTDKWHARDRETRRQETNLVAFLEFLIETQRALRESVKALTATAPADAFAEPKRLQDELQQEIPPLKEKIKTELAPQQPGGGSAPQGNSSELEQGITLLQGWADAAGDKMSSAARHLDDRQAGPAAADQQVRDRRAGEDLGCRDPVSPPAGSRSGGPDEDRPIARSRPLPPIRNQGLTSPLAKNDPHRDETKPAIERSIGRHRSCGTRDRKRRSGAAHRNPGANAPPDAIAQAQGRGRAGTTGKAAAARRGAEGARPILRKRRSARMPRPPSQNRSIPSRSRLVIRRRSSWRREPSSRWNGRSNRSNRRIARLPTRRPRRRVRFSKKFKRRSPEDQQDQKQQDQNKKNEDQQKQDQKDQQKNDQQKKDQQKDDREKKDQQKKDQEQKKQEEPSKSDEQKQDQKQPQPQVSRDRIEEALRKVRERQQEKRERDRMMKARVFGRVPVEKDW